MRKTYAPNAVIIGFLLGLVLCLKVSPVLGFIAAIVISVGGWILIRKLENALYKLGDKAATAADNAIRKKLEKNDENAGKPENLSEKYK